MASLHILEVDLTVINHQQKSFDSSEQNSYRQLTISNRVLIISTQKAPPEESDLYVHA